MLKLRVCLLTLVSVCWLLFMGSALAALPEGFVYLDEVSNIDYDARYSQADNFTGEPLPGYQDNRIAISRAMLVPLLTAQRLANEQGYQLLVWDAARPQRTVDRFIAWALEPETNKTRAKYYPTFNDKNQLFEQGFIARRSGHSRGSAIDLTLTDSTGKLLNMGTGFDYFGDKAHHGAAGLTAEQEHNRQTLVNIMTCAGFYTYPEEWWHYILPNEPYPGQYFDFVIEAKSYTSRM